MNTQEDDFDYNLDDIIIKDKAELHEHVTDEEIMLFYYGDFDIDGSYMSPFREETSPSFGIFYNSQGLLRWKDWGLFEQAQDAIAYVQKIKEVRFHQALTLIYEEIVMGKDPRATTKDIYKLTKNKGGTYTKGVKIRRYWKDFEVAYWARLRATPELLMKRFKIYPCEGVWFNSLKWHGSIKGDPLFLYLFCKTTESWKAYRPKSKIKEDKFKTNNITNHIQGFDDLPKKGRVVVITSSQKDRIPWYHAKIHSIAPHNENIILGEAIMNDLKTRFKYVIVNMNSDSTGLKANAEYVRRYQIISWHVPLDYVTCTDPTELWVTHGEEAFMKEVDHILELNKKL